MKNSCCLRDKTCECGVKLLPKNSGFTLKELIDHFIKKRRPCFEEYLEYYRKDSCLTLDEAVKRATLSKYENGKMHPHQRRIGHKKLKEAHKKQKDVDFSKVTSFDELHSLVRKNLKPIPGIGILAYYDIAHRIGVFFDLKPQKVYLHSGVKKGAQNLGIDCARGTLEMKDLRPEFNLLTLDEIEDFFCVYKTVLKEIKLSQ